ncbi:rhomboid family intramembrane serine protease [Pontibacter liquoris]|uniref:rhomboid family intramembrane serine protease n=1 Tax=Pontibacter liquoris TaxID=2905677 RepID=UPI001FA7B422|nr:rhomboid family intramembrane serine protease [Pontibacter liquoris]
MELNVTLILIAITVVVSWAAWQKPELLHNWIFQPYAVQRDNSWYRFLTSGFLHADFSHLFFNMFTLYFFGSNVEYTLVGVFGTIAGELVYLLVYLGGIIMSDLPTFFKHRNDPAYRALGASGGVASVLFASILFYPTNSVCLFVALCVPGFIFGVLYMMYSYFSGKRMGDNINHDAHFYGALFGIVVALAAVPQAGPYFIEQISNWRLF